MLNSILFFEIRKNLAVVLFFAAILWLSVVLSQAISEPSGLLDRILKQENLVNSEILQIKRYSVSGSSPAEIRENLNKMGLVDQNGMRRDGYTGWHINWNWQFNSDGKPDFASTKAELKVKMHLPEWIPNNTVSPELENIWQSFITALIKHEKVHLNFVLSNYKQVEESIIVAAKNNPALSSSEANQIGYGVLQHIRALDRNFDKETDNGKLEGVTLQPIKKIESTVELKE